VRYANQLPEQIERLIELADASCGGWNFGHGGRQAVLEQSLLGVRER
jgi:hypothetical protein